MVGSGVGTWTLDDLTFFKNCTLLVKRYSRLLFTTPTHCATLLILTTSPTSLYVYAFIIYIYTRPSHQLYRFLRLLRRPEAPDALLFFALGASSSSSSPASPASSSTSAASAV